MVRLILVMLALVSHGVDAFVCAGRSKASYSFSSSSSLVSMKKEDKDKAVVSGYIDDCFGLVFLSGLLVAKDYVFCSTFTVLSFVAVQTRNSSIMDQRSSSENMQRVEQYLIPSAVCLNAYVTSSVISNVFRDTLLHEISALPAWENPTLTGVTLASVVYGIVMSTKKNA